MPDTSNNDFTIKAWLENYDLNVREDQVRRLWHESVGFVTVLEKIRRSGEPSEELFMQYRAGIVKCKKWRILLNAIQEYQNQNGRSHLMRWIDAYGVESLPWKGTRHE